MGLVSLGVGYLYYSARPDAPPELWRTMIFTTLTLSQMGNALATRSERDTIWQIGLLSNKFMLGSVLLTLALQLAVIYVPFLNQVFSTVPLSPQDLLVSFAFSLVIFLAVETFKWMRQRK
jgi:Ca2+-transporting ATPase